jgi:hypothetical protein
VVLLIVDSSRFCTAAQWQASISLRNLFPANRWKIFDTKAAQEDPIINNYIIQNFGTEHNTALWLYWIVLIWKNTLRKSEGNNIYEIVALWIFHLMHSVNLNETRISEETHISVQTRSGPDNLIQTTGSYLHLHCLFCPCFCSRCHSVRS